MSLLTLTLLIVFLGLNIANYEKNYSDVKRNLDRGIIELQKNEEDVPLTPGFNPNHDFNPKEDVPLVFSFGVIVDKDNNISSTYHLNDSDVEYYQEAIDTVIKADKDSGKISDYNLLYLKRYFLNKDETAIIFTNIDNINRNFNTSILISGVSFIALLIIFYFIVLFLSKQIVKPVEDVWNKQKIFIQDASHDLKTPLTVILANNDILKAHKEDKIEEQMEWIDSTKDEATRMKNLVIQMLETAQSENMINNIVLSSVNLSELTLSNALQFETIAFDNDITIETDIDEDIIIDSNADCYNRILHILIDNAIKYSYKGKEVTISLKKNKKNISLAIKNIGDIIDDETLSHLFDRFYRAEKNRGSEGFGLGLAIAKNLTESLGGKIKCQSDENGTVFKIDFKC